MSNTYVWEIKIRVRCYDSGAGFWGRAARHQEPLQMIVDGLSTILDIVDDDVVQLESVELIDDGEY
jgi:hypothetical protein